MAPLAAQLAETLFDVSVPGLPGRLFVPDTAAGDIRRRPLVVALHGGGGFGTDNLHHVADFEDLVAVAAERGFFVYLPQAAPVSWYQNDRPARLRARIETLMVEHRIDAERVYLTGFSIGGAGTWSLYQRFPDLFAAAVPICGVSVGSAFPAGELARRPLWVFHARNDPVVEVVVSRLVVERVLAGAGLPAIRYPEPASPADFELRHDPWLFRYTEWATGSHGIWSRVYRSAELYDWLLERTLSGGPVEVPPHIVDHPRSQTLPESQPLELRVEAEGKGVDGLTYQWFHDGEALAGATGSMLRREAGDALLPGRWHVVVADDRGSAASRPAFVRVGPAVVERLRNISVRARVTPVAPVVILGVVTVGGEVPVLTRAAGPALVTQAVVAPLADPVLSLYRRLGTTEVPLATNDDWGGTPSLMARGAQAGAFPFPETTSRDAAVEIALQGVSTVHARAADRATGTAGVVLAELYDVSPGGGGEIVNLSARHVVTAGDGPLVAGFVLDGTVPRRVLVRGIGPGLSGAVGVTLADPRLHLFRHEAGVAALFAFNDDWNDEPDLAGLEFESVGAFALESGSHDAVLRVVLPPGVYTAQLTGRNDTPGEGLIELYLAAE